jgi:Integrase core domain
MQLRNSDSDEISGRDRFDQHFVVALGDIHGYQSCTPRRTVGLGHGWRSSRRFWLCTLIVSGVSIPGHGRFPIYYGSELVSKAMEDWAYQFRFDLDFIRPGRPVENGYIESFNGRLRDECLNVQVFFALADVRGKLELWRHDYDRVRPHSSLNDRTFHDFARALGSSEHSRRVHRWAAAGVRRGALTRRLLIRNLYSFSVRPRQARRAGPKSC